MSHDSKTGKRKITTNKTKNKTSVPAAPAMSEEAGGDGGGGGTPLGGGTPGAGTNVNLEAYIWQENVEAGLVVMNVKWRGKTYCGAFIDIEKHNWQPPRLGEPAAAEGDHFTRGRNKRSLNSESERGEEDSSNKRGRNKGKKKRGPPPHIKKAKKGATEPAVTADPAPSAASASSPAPSAASTEDKAQSEDKPEPENPEPSKVEVKAEPEEGSKTPAPSTTPAPATADPTPSTPVATQNERPVPTKEEETEESQSVINTYSPHSKKVKNSNKLTPIPKEMYGPETVIRTFNSPLNMPPIKPFINASPRSLGGYVVPNQEMMNQGDISASKPQVIVKPERRDLQWSKHGNLPVLKPQPHFTSHENSQNPQNMLPVHALLNHHLMKEQQLQHQHQQQQQHHQQQMKKNEQFLPFKPNEPLGNAFKSPSLFSKPNSTMSSASEFNAFSNLQRHYFHQAAAADKPPEMVDHRPAQEQAAHSLLQLARPFSSKGNNPSLDQLHYFNRMNNIPTAITSSAAAAAQPPAPFPPPRFSAENKEELAKLMSFPSVGPKFTIPQVGKFR